MTRLIPQARCIVKKTITSIVATEHHLLNIGKALQHEGLTGLPSQDGIIAEEYWNDNISR